MQWCFSVCVPSAVNKISTLLANAVASRLVADEPTRKAFHRVTAVGSVQEPLTVFVGFQGLATASELSPNARKMSSLRLISLSVSS